MCFMVNVLSADANTAKNNMKIQTRIPRNAVSYLPNLKVMGA